MNILGGHNFIVHHWCALKSFSILFPGSHWNHWTHVRRIPCTFLSLPQLQWLRLPELRLTNFLVKNPNGKYFRFVGYGILMVSIIAGKLCSWDQSQRTQIKVRVAVSVPLTLSRDCLTDKTLRRRCRNSPEETQLASTRVLVNSKSEWCQGLGSCLRHNWFHRF